MRGDLMVRLPITSPVQASVLSCRDERIIRLGSVTWMAAPSCAVERSMLTVDETPRAGVVSLIGRFACLW